MQGLVVKSFMLQERGFADILFRLSQKVHQSDNRSAATPAVGWYQSRSETYLP